MITITLISITSFHYNIGQCSFDILKSVIKNDQVCFLNFYREQKITNETPHLLSLMNFKFCCTIYWWLWYLKHFRMISCTFFFVSKIVMHAALAVEFVTKCFSFWWVLFWDDSFCTEALLCNYIFLQLWDGPFFRPPGVGGFSCFFLGTSPWSKLRLERPRRFRRTSAG